MFNELKGTWLPARECIVLRLKITACIAWSTIFFVLCLTTSSAFSPVNPSSVTSLRIFSLVSATYGAKSLSKFGCDWPPNISFCEA